MFPSTRSESVSPMCESGWAIATPEIVPTPSWGMTETGVLDRGPLVSEAIKQTGQSSLSESTASGFEQRRQELDEGMNTSGYHSIRQAIQ
jgi:hypothetical protein